MAGIIGIDAIIKTGALEASYSGGGDAITFIIVDGYNVIGISHGDLAKQRENLVRLLAEYRKAKGHSIIVVFDGWKSGCRQEETISTAGIKIIYSRLGEKADSVIKRIVSAEKREWVVISSDREIAAHAWSQGSVPVASEKFLTLLENTGTTFSGEYDLWDEDPVNVPKKGSSRTASKKEKALLRILGKL